MADVLLQSNTLKAVLSGHQGYCLRSLTHVQHANVIDAFDDGRNGSNLSLYGSEDYGLWNGRPWAFNPIQGGSWTNEGAPRIASQRKISPTQHACSIVPTDWSTSKLAEGFRYDQNIEIIGDVLIVKQRPRQIAVPPNVMVGPPRHQEVSAWFLKRDYSSLRINGVKHVLPNLASGANGYFDMPQGSIFGLVASTGIGVWFRHSSSVLVTGYVTGTRARDKGACAYIAPLDVFPLTESLDRAYETRVFIGTEAQAQKKLAV